MEFNLKNARLILAGAFLSLSLYSCDNDAIIEGNEVVQGPHFISEKDAEKNVLDFLQNLEPKTRSGKQLRQIKNVVPVMASAGTRSVSSDEPLYYVVNFADGKGFALASSDDREPEVYAYVESGEYSNETENDGYNIFINNLTTRRINEINDSEYYDLYNGSNGSNETRVSSLDKPDLETDYDSDIAKRHLLELYTKWGQGMPYNNITMAKGYECTGSVVTALGQICSYLNQPEAIPIRNYNKNSDNTSYVTLDWDNINEESKKFNFAPKTWYSPDVELKISSLMWYLLQGANPKRISSTYTSADIDAAVKTLQTRCTNAYVKYSGLVDYYYGNVEYDLMSGNIVYMEGYNNDHSLKHAWVVDGFCIHSRRMYSGGSRIYVDSRFLHCNWGYNGYLDGYYNENCFDLSYGPNMRDNKDNMDIVKPNYCNDVDYCSGLRTATFSTFVPIGDISVDNFYNKLSIECSQDDYTDAVLYVYKSTGVYPQLMGKSEIKGSKQTCSFDVDTWSQGEYFATLKFNNNKESFTKYFSLNHIGRQPGFDVYVNNDDIIAKFKLTYGVSSGTIKVISESEFQKSGPSGKAITSANVSGYEKSTSFYTKYWSRGNYYVALFENGRMVTSYRRVTL